jgi:hypothetical protein
VNVDTHLKKWLNAVVFLTNPKIAASFDQVRQKLARLLRAGEVRDEHSAARRSADDSRRSLE